MAQLVRILCAVPGFRRAGVAHAADTVWPVDAFSAEQWAQIAAEPNLTLFAIDDEVFTKSDVAPAADHAAAGTESEGRPGIMDAPRTAEPEPAAGARPGEGGASAKPAAQAETGQASAAAPGAAAAAAPAPKNARGKKAAG